MIKAVTVDPTVLIGLASRQLRDNVPTVCGVEDCGRPHRALNLCTAHYLRLWKIRKNGSLKFDSAYEDVSQYESATATACNVPGCGGELVGRGLCRKHYQRVWRANAKVA